MFSLLYILLILDLNSLAFSQSWLSGSIADAGKLFKMDKDKDESNKMESLLPFPTKPGDFWSKALKAVYGPAHVLFGISLWPNITVENGTTIKGPIIGGIIATIGVGISKKSKIQVLLHITDLLLFNYDGSIVIEADRGKSAEDGALVSLDVEKVLENFLKFSNPGKWAKIGAEFNKDPKLFFEKQLEMFYPAELTLNFNVKGFMGLENVLSRENRITNAEVISLSVGSVKEFPPKQLAFALKKPVDLINRKGDTVATIQKLTTVFAHPFPDERPCQALVQNKLAESTIRDFVSKIVDL